MDIRAKHNAKKILFFSDIISIENTPSAKRNIFRELNIQYNKLVHTRKEMFLSEIDTPQTTSNDKTFPFSVTLLPHQIFLMPESYQSAVDRDFLSNFKIYSDAEIR
jgi:hypothetical protein